MENEGKMNVTKQDGEETISWRRAVCLFMEGQTIAISIIPLIEHLFSHLSLITSRFCKCLLKIRTAETKKK